MTVIRVPNEIRSLTAFRFFAALYVFLFHLEIRAAIFGDGMIGDFISEGAVGMSMFFVLSGFILTHAYGSQKINLSQFFWNRFACIYPIYLLAAVLALPWLARGMLLESRLTSPLFAILSGLVLLVFGLLLIQAWLPQAFGFRNNGASWSISNEAFFYSVFPFARDMFLSVDSRRLAGMFSLLCLLSSLVPVSAIVFSNAPESFALFYALPFYRLAEFLCGMISYISMKRIRWNRKKIAILLSVVLLGTTHVALLGDILPSYTLHNWIVIPAVASALILLYQSELSGNSVLCWPIFVWLGQISYCFYSFQFHVLEGLRFVMPIEKVGGWIYAGVATTLLLVVSAVAHHYVEEPARRWIRSRNRLAQTNTGATS